MKDDEIIKIAAVGIIVLVVAPAVVNGTISLVSLAATGISNKINTVKFNKKIKKGLKDGSIVEIDGKYYEVEESKDEA